MLKVDQKTIDFVNQYLFCNYNNFYCNPSLKEDLVSQVLLEICEHAKEYDPEVATPKAFMTPHIKRGVLKFSMNMHGETEYYEKLRMKASRAANTLESEGVKATPQAIAEMLGVSKTGIEKVRDTGMVTLTKIIPASQNIEEDTLAKEKLCQAEAILAKLPEKERAIIEAKADAVSKRDFFEKVRNLGIEKQKETIALRKAQNHAKKLFIQEYGMYA